MLGAFFEDFENLSPTRVIAVLQHFKNDHLACSEFSTHFNTPCIANITIQLLTCSGGICDYLDAKSKVAKTKSGLINANMILTARNQHGNTRRHLSQCTM